MRTKSKRVHENRNITPLLASEVPLKIQISAYGSPVMLARALLS